ncbi:MAG: radical SAM protein [Thermoplasmata archaeon]|nr:MAG: radical SAM protein [Thermoplasmata archaeon]
MNVMEVECDMALSESRLPGYDYSLNPYRGCFHGCTYCYVPNMLNIPRKEWGHFVEIKRNIPKVLAGELKRKKKGLVGLSTTTDPYQPLEKEYEVTRYCLEQLLRRDFPLSIITKSDLVIRDIDLISRFSEAEIGFTITTDNDSERLLLETNAPSIESRMEAMKKCSENGITTYAFLGPLYPTVRKENLHRFVEKLMDSGAQKIMADRLNLRPGVLDRLNQTLGSKKAKAWKEGLFGKHKPYDALFSHLEKTCQELGVEFEMQTY